jgi:uncharacterized OsmC-like protein
MSITSTWIKNYQSVVDNGREDAVVMDLPAVKNGQNSGATALEVSVMALAGCLTTIFMVVATSMRINTKIESLRAIVDYHHPQDAPTITEVEIDLHVKSSLDEKTIQKCLTRTLDVCPVGKLFEQAKINMTHKLIML